MQFVAGAQSSGARFQQNERSNISHERPSKDRTQRSQPSGLRAYKK